MPEKKEEATTAAKVVQIDSSSTCILCKFDEYGNGKKGSRHKEINFALSKRKPIHSLVNDTVARINESLLLSTIAIYDKSHDRTFVVLHSKPSVSVDQNISIGQQIGTEDKRDASSAHTRLEIRPRRRTGVYKKRVI